MSSRSLLSRVVSSLALALFLGLTLAVTAPAALAGIIVVALDGSGDTTSVTTAVNSASPGDVILVREGFYQAVGPFDPEGFHTVDVPVTIVGEGAGAIIGMIRVANIPAGQEVVLRNLTLQGAFLNGAFVEKLGVFDCAGAVVVEDCTINGLMGVYNNPQGLPAVKVSNSAGVTFTRCTLRGGMGLGVPSNFPFDILPGPGGPGVLVNGGKVAFHHCTIVGGEGGTDEHLDTQSMPGGDALTITTTSTVFAAGGSITGGAGNDGGPPEAPLDAQGGDGLVMHDPFSSVRLVGVTPQGGAGGVLGDDSLAPPGEAQVITGGSLTVFDEVARGTGMPATLHPGEPATLSITGAPGELGKIMVGLDLVHAQLGGKKGVFNLGSPLIGPLVLGTIPASGVLEVPVAFPPGTLLGLPALRVDFQALTFGADGLMFGNPSSTLLLAQGL